MPRPLSRSGRGQSFSAIAGNSRSVRGAGSCGVGDDRTEAGGVGTAVARAMVAVAVAGSAVDVAAATIGGMAVEVAGTGVDVRGIGVLVAWLTTRVFVGVTVGWADRAQPLLNTAQSRMKLTTSFLEMIVSLED